MNKRGLMGFLILIVVLLIVGFIFFLKNYDSPSQTTANESEENSNVSLANPASQYCINQGHFLEIRDSAEGQNAYCISVDGQVCEEWSFFRGECSFEGYPLCIPDSCCHSDNCVISDFPLTCQETVCTMECRGGTMDCGAGNCAFVDGNCEVVWNEP